MFQVTSREEKMRLKHNPKSGLETERFALLG